LKAVVSNGVNVSNLMGENSFDDIFKVKSRKERESFSFLFI